MTIMTGIKGNWLEVKGKIKEKWGKFTDDEIEVMDGKKEKLIGSLIRKYEMTQEDAEREVSRFWK